MRARERLTAATAELIQRHGVAGTGIAEILAVSGVTRRSIYLNFPGGKAELVAAATRSAGDEMAAVLRDCLADPDPIRSFTRMWAAILTDSDFDGGCPILAAAAGREAAPEAADAAAEVFTAWTRLVADRLVADGVKPAAAQSLATTIVAAFEGAAALSRVARSTAPLEMVAEHMAALVENHRPDRGSQPPQK